MGTTIQIRFYSGRATAFVALLALAASMAVAMLAVPQSARALGAADFNPGLIISDSSFYDSAALSESQIQAFLSSNGSGLSALRFDVDSRSRLVSDSTGNLRCEAFTGGSALLPSTIIYRAQVACGISARVILVTLQKEQGLISRASPSQAALDRAMGMACPDTAPCAATSLGFGNQIYTGTLQLKTYRASRFGVQPGVHAVQWNPNSACSSGLVNIQNYATAALYNYTPYQPNAAALANLTGLGDECSSYGNRNFWVYYSNWFGPPTAVSGESAIAIEYADLGGSGGYLGSPVGSSNCSAGAPFCSRSFVGGVIYWTASSGAWPVTFAFNAVYASQGAALGGPTSGLLTIADGGGGTAQTFEHGSIYSGTPGAFAVWGTVASEYWRQSGADGALGWPTAAAVCVAATGNCSQSFQHGGIYIRGNGTTYSVSGAFETLYRANGGPLGAAGLPTSNLVPMTLNGGGSGQSFENASVYSSSSGTYLVSGALRAAYWDVAGADGSFGWPTAAQVCAGTACTQSFQHGSLPFVPSGTAIADFYLQTGGAAGPLGPATSAVMVIPQNGGGQGQAFQSGSVYSSLASGTFSVTGAVAGEYWRLGGANGSLGWPTSPLVSISDSGGGLGQVFQAGSVYSSPVSGTFSVTGAVRVEYWRQQGAAGPLGWPTGRQICAAPAPCTQSFQGGSIG